MAEIDLKAYTNRAKELEAAIYTQKRLMDSHRNLLRNSRPSIPKKATIQAPVAPDPQAYEIDIWAGCTWEFWIGLALAAFGGFLVYSGFRFGFDNTGDFIGFLLWMVLAVFGVILTISTLIKVGKRKQLQPVKQEEFRRKKLIMKKRWLNLITI